MNKSPLLPTCAAALAIMALSCGCESAPVHHPRTTQTVVLSADHPSPDVEAGVVSAVEIVLPPGPSGSAGYAWEIASNNAKVLEEMGPLKPSPAADSSVAPGAKVSFYVLKTGKSVLRFVLVRQGDADAVPAASCSVTVRVTDE
jgi:predicted secreted protein